MEKMWSIHYALKDLFMMQRSIDFILLLKNNSQKLLYNYQNVSFL